MFGLKFIFFKNFVLQPERYLYVNVYKYKNSITGRVLICLLQAELGLISGAMHGPMSPSRMIPEYRNNPSNSGVA